MGCIGLGTLAGVPLELFIFPIGNYFLLEQVAQLFFLGNASKVVSLLPEHMPTYLIEDFQSKKIYISTDATMIISKAAGISKMKALSSINLDVVEGGHLKQILPSIEVIGSSEKTFMTISVQPYIIQSQG